MNIEQQTHTHTHSNDYNFVQESPVNHCRRNEIDNSSLAEQTKNECLPLLRNESE